MKTMNLRANGAITLIDYFLMTYRKLGLISPDTDSKAFRWARDRSLTKPNDSL